MTPDERAAAREACNKATEGPWTLRPSLDEYDRQMVGENYVAGLDATAESPNAVFCSVARTALPAALDDLDAKDKRIRELEAEVARLNSHDPKTASIRIQMATECDPFNTEECEVVDYSYSERAYMIQCGAVAKLREERDTWKAAWGKLADEVRRKPEEP